MEKFQFASNNPDTTQVPRDATYVAPLIIAGA
jgi:hypothetical protein